MLNKIVKVSNYQLIQFFYPEMKVRSELSLVDRDNSVLFIGKGKPRLKEWLGMNTKNFISVSGQPDIDLTDPEVLVKWVFSKRGKEPSQKILDQIKNMDLSYIEYLCKVYYVSGRWVSDVSSVDVTMFNLFQESTVSLKSCLEVYFKLREVYPYEVIESSFITFLSRVTSIEDQNVSSSYMRVLKQANQKYGNKIKLLVLRLGSAEDSELEFINMMIDLR